MMLFSDVAQFGTTWQFSLPMQAGKLFDYYVHKSHHQSSTSPECQKACFQHSACQTA
jgi:hypothetical protein